MYMDVRRSLMAGTVLRFVGAVHLPAQCQAGHSSHGAPGAGRTHPPRRELLLALASVPGVYCPQLYEPIYESDTGKLLEVQPVCEGGWWVGGAASLDGWVGGWVGEPAGYSAKGGQFRLGAACEQSTFACLWARRQLHMGQGGCARAPPDTEPAGRMPPGPARHQLHKPRMYGHQNKAPAHPPEQQQKKKPKWLCALPTLHAGVPPAVQKQTYRGSTLASSTVVSPRMAWESIFMTEVVRSCPEMCRCVHEGVGLLREGWVAVLHVVHSPGGSGAACSSSYGSAMFLIAQTGPSSNFSIYPSFACFGPGSAWPQT